MARVTLAIIAKKTGLSKFAVSRALSGKSGVSEETRRRVKAIAADLGYVRGSTRSEPLMLGVIFHDADLTNSELYLLIQNGFQTEAERLGYRMSMRWTLVGDEIEAFMRTCDGALMVGPHDKASVERAGSAGKPIVRQGWLDPLEQADFVGGADHEAGSAVANYLLSLGHRSIAYVHGKPGYRGRIERFYGVREVLERRSDVDYREMRFEAGKGFSEHLLAAHADGFRPTAFFCAHDGIGVTVISELLRLGYRIPEDASVVGFGDYSAAMQISPPLTTVKIQGLQVGAAGARLLDDRIMGRIPPDVPVRIQIASRIVERSSSGPLPEVAALAPRAVMLAG
jgi:LacI family transcriptional regulator